MGNWIELDTAAGKVKAWHAPAQGASRGALIVWQEIFGVNAHIRAVADGYAAEGYDVLAPAPFDLVEPGVDLAYTPEGVQRGIPMMQAVGIDKAVQIVEAAAQYLDAPNRTGIVGYCWGGTVALVSAIRLGLPASSYYGGGNIHFIGETPKVPVIFHYGEKDAHITPDITGQFKAKFGDAVYLYPADHAFNRDADPHVYDAASAKLARQRTLDFFATNLK